MIMNSEALGKRNVDMRKLLSSGTDLPVKVDEEFRLLLQSRLWREPLPKGRSAVALSAGLLGAGGGHALAIDGRIYAGRNGMAGLPGWRMEPPYNDPPGKLGGLPRTEVRDMGGAGGYLKSLDRREPVALEVFDKALENYAYRLGQIANYLSPDTVFVYTPYLELGAEFLEQLRDRAIRYTEAESLEGMGLHFGGRRSDEERLVAAAIPVLATFFEEGVLRESVLAGHA
jgi:predicted NBD/HSP70 family sugar kinase